MFGFFKDRRRQKLLEQPLPDEWQQNIERNVAVFSLLSADEQRRLLDATKVIVGERRFVASSGLTMSDEIKTTIAAQAALLLLGEEGYYFDRVPTIFVHPQWHKTKVTRVVQDALFFEPPHI